MEAVAQIEIIFSSIFIVLFIIESFIAWRTSKRFISKTAGEFQLQSVV